MAFEETRLSQEKQYAGRIVHVTLDQVRLSDGTDAVREVVHHPGGVAVLALDSDDQVIVVRQWRYAMGEEVLELPAGKLEPGEDPAEAGRRELKEETGYTCGRYEPLGQVYATPGYCTEKIYLFLARDLTPGECCLDQGELLTADRLPLKELVERVLRGEIRDGKTIAAVLKVWTMRQRETGAQ